MDGAEELKCDAGVQKVVWAAPQKGVDGASLSLASLWPEECEHANWSNEGNGQRGKASRLLSRSPTERIKKKKKFVWGSPPA